MRLLFLAIAVFLAGCATFVESDVARFHQLDQEPLDKTYFLQAAPGQSGDLEFLHYSGLIESGLRANGYSKSAPSAAGMVASFVYRIDNGRATVSSYPIFGSTGGATSRASGTLTAGTSQYQYSGTISSAPKIGVVGSGVSSDVVYMRQLDFFLRKQSAGADGGRILYQATVKSEGVNSSLSAVMPAMIEALFKEFPGKSGEAKTIRISLPGQ